MKNKIQKSTIMIWVAVGIVLLLLSQIDPSVSMNKKKDMPKGLGIVY